MAFAVFLERPEDVQGAAAAQPGAHLQRDPGFHGGIQNRVHDESALLGVQLPFDGVPGFCWSMVVHVDDDTVYKLPSTPSHLKAKCAARRRGGAWHPNGKAKRIF